jgi:hypothetical protein
LNSIESLDIQDFKFENIGLRKGYRLNFDEREGLLTVETGIDFMYTDKKNEPQKLFGVLVELQFHFQDFDGIISKVDENLINVPDQLTVNLISIAYSTARGILFCLTSKSDYDGVYLPLTDPNEFHNTINQVE